MDLYIVFLEQQVSPATVDQAVAQHPVPMLPVPDVVCIELQRVGIQRPSEALGADRDGDKYQEKSCHILYFLLSINYFQSAARLLLTSTTPPTIRTVKRTFCQERVSIPTQTLITAAIIG